MDIGLMISMVMAQKGGQDNEVRRLLLFLERRMGNIPMLSLGYKMSR